MVFKKVTYNTMKNKTFKEIFEEEKFNDDEQKAFNEIIYLVKMANNKEIDDAEARIKMILKGVCSK